MRGDRTGMAPRGGSRGRRVPQTACGALIYGTPARFDGTERTRSYDCREAGWHGRGRGEASQGARSRPLARSRQGARGDAGRGVRLRSAARLALPPKLFDHEKMIVEGAICVVETWEPK